MFEPGDSDPARCAYGRARNSSADGVLFNKSKTDLIQHPARRAGSYAIPKGVINIGREAFYAYELLVDVTIPNTVTSIGLDFIISWATNATVVVEASTDLAGPAWSPLSTNTLANGIAYFRDTEWTNYLARFYGVAC